MSSAGARLRELDPTLARIELADREVWVISASFGNADRIADRLRELVDRRTRRRTTLVVIGGGRDEQCAAASALPAFAMGRTVEAIAIADDGTIFGEPARAARSEVARAAMSSTATTLDELRARMEAQPVARPAAQPHGSGLAAAPVTQAIIAAWVVMLLLEYTLGGPYDTATLARMGGVTEATLHGEPWRLLASSWLHMGVGHLLSNALLLLLAGPPLERWLGSVRMLLVHGAAVLAGALGSMGHAAMNVGIGGSGGAIGVVAATVLLLARPRDMIPPDELSVLRRRLMIFALVLWGIPALLMLALGVTLGAPLFVLMPGVDHPVHLFGAIAGAAAFLLLRNAPESWASRLRTTARVVVGAHVLSVVLALVMGRPWERGVEIPGVVAIAEPSPPVEHRLPDIGATMMVPADLGAPKVQGDGLSTSYLFGESITASFWLAVTHTPIAPPLAPADLRAEFELELVDGRHEERGTRWPTFFEIVRRRESELMTRGELHPNGWFLVEAEYPADDRARTAVEAAMRSLKVDGD